MPKTRMNRFTWISREDDEILLLKKPENIPNVDELEKVVNEHHLVCFDGMLLEKNRKVIKKYCNRGRKKNTSVIYLFQAYAETGARQLPSIRKNANNVVLFRLQEESTFS